MASIDKRGNSYRVRWRTPGGLPRNKSFDRLVEAKRFATQIEHSKLSGGYVDPAAGRKLFGEWWQECQQATVHLRASTRARDESYGRQYLLPAFENMTLSQLDHLGIKQWVAELSARGLSAATVTKAKQLLNRTLNSAVDAGLISTNPAARVETPKIEREEMRFLTPPQIFELANNIDPRFKAFVLVAAYSGLRFGELAALRREQINLLSGRIDVVATVSEVKGHHVLGAPKTRAGRRSVPLPRSIVRVIEDHIKAVGPNDLVFSAPDGGYLRGSLFRPRIWHPAVGVAGLAPLRCHDLRHTAVALWIAAGASAKEVADRAGHASVVTVLDRYGHLLPGSEDKVNDALDVMFDVASGGDTKVTVLAIRQ